MAFSKRLINLRFQLGTGDFGQGGFDTVDLEGLRCSATISKAGGLSMSVAELRVWGMPLDMMNKLTVLNKRAFGEMIDNRLVIMAGDEDSGVSVAFQGTIQEAWADGRNAPDVMFHVAAFSGLFEGSRPIPPTSYAGPVDIAIAVAGIAQQMGLGFENNGVTGTLTTPYWPGDAGDQLRAACEAVGCNYLIDTANEVVAIWPRNGSRDHPAIEVNRDTGLVGYPSFTQSGIQFQTLYNPNLAYGMNVKLESQFSAANGIKGIVAVTHSLDAGVPGGDWFSEVECGLLDFDAAQAAGIAP